MEKKDAKYRKVEHMVNQKKNKQNNQADDDEKRKK